MQDMLLERTQVPKLVSQIIGPGQTLVSQIETPGQKIADVL